LLDLAAQAARTVGAGMGDIEWYRRLSSLLGYRKVGQASRLIDWARSRIGLRGRHQRGPN
jgi:predicted porin